MLVGGWRATVASSEGSAAGVGMLGGPLEVVVIVAMLRAGPRPRSQVAGVAARILKRPATLAILISHGWIDRYDRSRAWRGGWSADLGGRTRHPGTSAVGAA
jgi:hypothetical protein